MRICVRVHSWGTSCDSSGWHLAAENLCGMCVYLWAEPDHRSRAELQLYVTLAIKLNSHINRAARGYCSRRIHV